MKSMKPRQDPCPCGGEVNGRYRNEGYCQECGEYDHPLVKNGLCMSCLKKNHPEINADSYSLESCYCGNKYYKRSHQNEN
jgi:NMD protein affecting ribosome stability and mRNA decay